MMPTMGSDVAPVQRGASVQLYHKALRMFIQHVQEATDADMLLWTVLVKNHAFGKKIMNRSFSAQWM